MKNKEWNTQSNNKISYQHIKLQSSQTHVPREKHKITVNNSQDNTFPLDSHNRTTRGPEYHSIAEAQVKKKTLK